MVTKVREAVSANRPVIVASLIILVLVGVSVDAINDRRAAERDAEAVQTELLQDAEEDRIALEEITREIRQEVAVHQDQSDLIERRILRALRPLYVALAEHAGLEDFRPPGLSALEGDGGSRPSGDSDKGKGQGGQEPPGPKPEPKPEPEPAPEPSPSPSVTDPVCTLLPQVCDLVP